MNPNDAAKLLAVAAAFDNRKPDATSAQAWAMALGDRRFEDCQQAIVKHYQDSTEWIMPAHVIAAVRKVRTGRLEDVALSPPADMDPDDTARYAKWLEVSRRAVADGRDPTESDYNPTRAIGELRGVLRAIPSPVRPPAPRNTSEHDAAKARARTELRARAEVPVAEPETDALLEANGGLATPAMQETDEEGETA